MYHAKVRIKGTHVRIDFNRCLASPPGTEAQSRLAYLLLKVEEAKGVSYDPYRHERGWDAVLEVMEEGGP